MADDVIKQTIKFNQGHIDVKREQPNADAMLHWNERMRLENAVRPTDGIRWALRIPDLELMELTRRNPALNSLDAKERTNAWLAFCKSPESLPYRVREKI